MTVPPFCPNPECSKHHHTARAVVRWWVRNGYYTSARSGRTRRIMLLCRQSVALHGELTEAVTPTEDLVTEGVSHATVSSRLPRTGDNPLFAVNYLDREIRKDLAEHHRETVCFARHAVLSTARMWIYQVWHNVDKAYRICPRAAISHAEAAGIPASTVRRARRQLLTQRAFLRRSRLSHLARTLWVAMIPTPERQHHTTRRLTPACVLA